MRHPRQVPPSVTKRLLPPASQPSSSFAPSPLCCSRVGRLRFKGDSILFQRQMCYLLLCVVSLSSARTKCSSNRSLGYSGEKATVARTLANRQLLRDLNLRSSSSSIFAACRPHNAWHSPRAQLSMLNAVRIASTLLSKMQD